MEKAKEMLKLSKQESDTVSKLTVNPHLPNLEMSFYEDFSLRGIRVDRVEPGLVVCSFKVPPRLTDRDDKLTPGAIANLVDEIGAVVIYREGLPMNVSVTMSISYVSTAKVDDELEITSRLLGQKGSTFGTIVLFKNKASGDIVAEGRHTLFSKHASKI
ncbi:Acyl-coenzyme A thioesterase 13 [Bienertia sinuspersici]